MKLHPLHDSERFLKLATVLVQAQCDLDECLTSEIIDPREALPTLGIVRMLAAEMEELLLQTLSPNQMEADTVADARRALMEYVPPAGDPRLPIAHQGRAAELIRALADALIYKHHRLSDERLDQIIADMQRSSQVDESLGLIAQALQSKPGGMVS